MRVLIGTGGAPHSEIAIRQVAELAKVTPVTATVVSVIKHSEDQNDADVALARALDILQSTAEKVITKTRIGSAAEEIVAEGETGRYDLIVLGQRPSRSIFARFRGQVTRYVVDHSTLSILIAKGQPQPFEQILVCDSGAKSPSLLQQFRLHLPGLLSSVKEITILHVMSQISAYPTVINKDLTASAEELMKSNAPEGGWLEQDLEYLEQMKLSTTAKVRHGLVIDEIVAEARAGNYDLVVIGAHRTENLPRFLLDDQARELVGEIDRATLVVR